MREILFRGKTDKGEWVEGYVFEMHILGDKTTYISTKPFMLCNDGDFDYEPFAVDTETVGQYTGLIDKNGTKIFEGDIVSISGDFKGIYTCVWEEYHFDYELENKTMRCCLACVYSDDIKVIGNIHDNPELLKGGAE